MWRDFLNRLRWWWAEWRGRQQPWTGEPLMHRLVRLKDEHDG